MNIKKVLIGFIILLALTACAALEITPETAEESTNESAFLTEVIYDDFETLSLDNFLDIDFINISFPGKSSVPVIWNDRLFINSLNYVQEYNLDGEMVAYVNPGLGTQPRDLVLIGDSLFIAYYNVGVYEVNLNSNEIVYLYDTANGLEDLSNLNLAVNGEELWVGTYNGVAKIDTDSHEVSFYEESHLSSKVYAGGGEAWVTVGSNSAATRYDAATDSFDVYGAADFQTGESDGSHFRRFVVSEEGAFAAYYDDEPKLLTLKKYNSEEKTWETLYTNSISDEFYATIEEYLPAKETYMQGEYADHIFSVSYKGEWMGFDINPKEYLSIIRGDEDTYYLLSNQGLEMFGRESDLPEFLVENLVDYSLPNYNLFVTEDEKYLVSLLVDVQSYGGPKWNDFYVAAYDFETEELFTASLDLREMDIFQSWEVIGDLEVENLEYTYDEDVLTIQFLDEGEFVFDVFGGRFEFENF